MESEATIMNQRMHFVFKFAYNCKLAKKKKILDLNAHHKICSHHRFLPTLSWRPRLLKIDAIRNEFIWWNLYQQPVPHEFIEFHSFSCIFSFQEIKQEAIKKNSRRRMQKTYKQHTYEWVLFANDVRWLTLHCY